ncbi:MAG: RtcB family protein [Desulfobulbaceae bacterium]|nr:RtcB family protein [Desulfobulbaceae bacterium]
MKKAVTSEKLPILTWADELDDDAMAQAKNLANLPFAFHHIALMADAHVGYGMPIGGVLATQGAVIPNGVGVDIGCGMHAVRTDLHELSREQLKNILGTIRQRIPLGFKHHRRPKAQDLMPEFAGRSFEEDLPVVRAEFDSARRQLGTLGGGNHFIEIQQGSDGYIWLMVHSGSRNLGYQVAGEYNKLAIRMADKGGNRIVPAKWQLDFLLIDSAEGRRYLREMTYCVEFAQANRREMMRVIQEVVANESACSEFSQALDVAHNYAAMEQHFGRTVCVHRKGAIRAGDGEQCIIPGSQGSSSYIVRGLGNPDAFSSCSHGAGRVMGRKEAQRSLDLAEELRKLEQRNVLHSIRGRKDLDEAPGAYKDISRVMANQRDLIEIEVELQPLAVVKG